MNTRKAIRRTSLLLMALAFGAAALLAPTAASADERPCRGSIGNSSVDDLRVPKGKTCVLTGTRVSGNIKVARGAVLKARNVRVEGNVQGTRARLVNVLRGSQIGGDVQVFYGNSANVRGSFIDGNIQFGQNSGFLLAANNRVNGDIQFFKNRGNRAKRVVNNRVDGNLQCKENRPRPTGGGNRVAGNKEDQCARL